tara:strand:+ start:79 stop:417 length:339 start_codon:yes stop_codon:yes gene_type:complete
MEDYRLLELLLKHQAYGKFSISHQAHTPTRDFYDDLMHEIEVEVSEKLGLELDSYGTVYREHEHPLFRAIQDILTYLEESESVGGEIDGWENLQEDLKDLWDKALEEIFPND